MNMRIGVLLALVAIAGCSTEEDRDPLQAFCSSFGASPVPTFAWTCNAGCTVADQSAVSDRNLSTTASIVPTAGATTETAVLRAESGVIPSGATVGVFVTQPATLNSTANSFQTFLNDVLQESSDSNNIVVSPSEEGTPAAGFLGMRTTKAFDAVEFTTTNTWNSGQTPVYYVYEICADGGNS